VQIDDEVFDNRISSSSGPYQMVGYSAADNQTFNEEVLESIRDQTLKTDPSSLKVK